PTHKCDLYLGRAFCAYLISRVESPCSGPRISGRRILRTRFYEPVFRLRAGFTIQRLVPDEYVHFRPPVALLCMQPHLVFIATGWNVPSQPSLSLPRAIKPFHGGPPRELTLRLLYPNPPPANSV